MSLKIIRDERVLHLILDRPEKRNALNAELCTALVDAITAAQTDATIGSVLIDSSGPVFCAGMDLDEATSPQASSLNAIHEKLFTIGATSKKPIVAAVMGPTLGGGIGLLANAHVVVAAQGTLFGLTEIRIGLWPFVIYRSVEAAIGSRRTLELSLTGRLFSVQEALTWGLVHHSAPNFEVDDRATQVARELSHASPDATALGLRYVHESRGKNWQEAGVLAGEIRQEAFQNLDFLEGVAAYREKRAPVWPSLPARAATETPSETTAKSSEK